MKKEIEITIFGKTRKSADGRKFTTYFCTLPGETDKTKVKFREECGSPKDTPVNIIIEQGACNLSKERYTVEKVDKTTGETTEETRESSVLWVSSWKKSITAFVDTSMDKYFAE